MAILTMANGSKITGKDLVAIHRKMEAGMLVNGRATRRMVWV